MLAVREHRTEKREHHHQKMYGETRGEGISLLLTFFRMISANSCQDVCHEKYDGQTVK